MLTTKEKDKLMLLNLSNCKDIIEEVDKEIEERYDTAYILDTAFNMGNDKTINLIKGLINTEDNNSKKEIIEKIDEMDKRDYYKYSPQYQFVQGHKNIINRFI